MKTTVFITTNTNRSATRPKQNKIFMKIFIGILSFLIGGIIATVLFRPIISSFITSETILDVLQVAVNIIIAVQIYRLVVKHFINKENDSN
ncbi:hypothetical protein [Olleya namhaensis]|uniref:hypothetical protein n=1 Tax=Olleya namhaensis TaxID=1144750 RepID=UPI0024906630|nr:hypothetical protein [Olleya namhaensis]